MVVYHPVKNHLNDIGRGVGQTVDKLGVGLWISLDELVPVWWLSGHPFATFNIIYHALTHTLKDVGSVHLGDSCKCGHHKLTCGSGRIKRLCHGADTNIVFFQSVDGVNDIFCGASEAVDFIKQHHLKAPVAGVIKQPTALGTLCEWQHTAHAVINIIIVYR